MTKRSSPAGFFRTLAPLPRSSRRPFPKAVPGSLPDLVFYALFFSPHIIRKTKWDHEEMVLSFLHGPIRIPMVFILQQDRDRRPRLHHIQRLRRYENWLSCRRLSRRRLSFVSGEGLFRFGVCFIIALFFYSFLIISLVRLLSLTAGLSTVSSLSSRSSSLAGTAWTPAVDAPWSTIP